jgi:hypothetical protein
MQSSGGYRRENADSHLSVRHCEEQSDEAIQTAPAETVWIASLTLAMTAYAV